MTLGRWLSEALHNLAPEVRRRLEAEYREHLRGALEAGVPEWQVLADLGDPKRLNRDLLATHLTEYEAKVLQSRISRWTPRTPWQPLAMGVGVSLVKWLQFRGEAPSFLLWQILPLLVVGGLCSAALLWLRRRWSREAFALYATPALNLTQALMWSLLAIGTSLASAWGVWLGVVLGGALLYLWGELAVRGELYRKARVSDWRPQ